jgi:hypothetical protein
MLLWKLPVRSGLWFSSALPDCSVPQTVSAGHSRSRDSGARLDEAPAEAPRTPSWWSSPAPTPSSSVATPTPGARAAATSRLSPEHGKPEGSLQEVLATKEKQIEELTTRLGALRDALTEQVRRGEEGCVSVFLRAVRVSTCVQAVCILSTPAVAGGQEQTWKLGTHGGKGGRRPSET